MKHILVTGLAVLLTACSITPPKPIQLSSSFDPNAVAWAEKPGGNTIIGTAVLRTVGGDAKTCAALPVFLVPRSAYALERLQHIYGYAASTGGYNPAFMGQNPTFANDDPRYHASMRQTICDAQGYFTFDHIPDGSFYVTAQVTWKAGGNDFVYQGGELMQPVSVKDGQTQRIVLSGP